MGDHLGPEMRVPAVKSGYLDMVILDAEVYNNAYYKTLGVGIQLLLIQVRCHVFICAVYHM